MMPPREESTTASTRNCNRTSRSNAPMASRIPISRVRSVTETSMMFIMPIPPTSRLTAATALSRAVIICVVPVSILASSFMSSTLKLSSSFCAICRRLRISFSISCWTVSVENPSWTEIWISGISFLPVIRRWAVRSGSSTMSS